MRSLGFSRHYASRAHQSQRSGLVLSSLPSLGEVEDMLHMQRLKETALFSIRTAVENQEQAPAEQTARRKASKPGEDEHMGTYQEESRDAGGYAGVHFKKRRRVSAVYFPFPF